MEPSTGSSGISLSFTFKLAPQLMYQYANMQSRIKKRECIEWEKFANSIAEFYEFNESEEEETTKETTVGNEETTATVVIKMEESEPEEHPIIVQEQLTVAKEHPATENSEHKDDASESGNPEKRTVIRWTLEEDEYLRELMNRFDNDFARVAKEMKTRNARQCKTRWDLLNRPADEKKRKGKKNQDDDEPITTTLINE